MNDLDQMRVLRYARSETPFTVTADRRKIVEGLARKGMLTVVGAGRSGTLMKLTKSGLELLQSLEKANPGVQDYALKQAIARMDRA